MRLNIISPLVFTHVHTYVHTHAYLYALTCTHTQPCTCTHANTHIQTSVATANLQGSSLGLLPKPERPAPQHVCGSWARLRTLEILRERLGGFRSRWDLPGKTRPSHTEPTDSASGPRSHAVYVWSDEGRCSVQCPATLHVGCRLPFSGFGDYSLCVHTEGALARGGV